MLVNFGQPLGGVVQFAYTVPDLDRAISDYATRLRIGPWFLRGPFQPDKAFYRGEPTSPRITLARAFSGHAMIELVFQHDETPSVFRERIAVAGYGFHHWAFFSTDVDADVERYAAQGYPVAFADTTPIGTRIVYVDATRDLPGMIELIEFTPRQERLYTDMYRAAIGWDGGDPVRRHPFEGGAPAAAAGTGGS